MRTVGTVIGIVLLASSLSFGQSRPQEMSSLESKYQQAQAAYDSRPTPSREAQLRDLRDELGYLRVKARRGQTVSTQERRDLSSRLDRFITDMNAIGTYRNDPGYRTDDPRPGRARDNASYGREIPTGTEIDVRLQTRLNSGDAQVEDRVEATTLVDLYQGNDLLVPAGSLMVGYVTNVEKATRLDRKGSLTVQFNRLTVRGRTHDIRGTVTEALESGGIKSEAERIGAGAGVGAIIGGIIGGVKGAITGILIGGGGVIAATEGKDVDVPAGSTLRVRFDSPVPLQ